LGASGDRRNFHRIKANFEVPGLGEVQNISADGMCLLVQNPFVAGRQIDLEFRPLPEASLVKCKGEIVWHQYMADGRVRVGLRFIWPTASER
jgi:hypothetical protein